MPHKANMALIYSRRYSQGLESMASERAFEWLVPVLGISAATIYYALRRYYGTPAQLALSRARQQVQQLGRDHPGGPDCSVFRRPML